MNIFLSNTLRPSSPQKNATMLGLHCALAYLFLAGFVVTHNICAQSLPNAPMPHRSRLHVQSTMLTQPSSMSVWSNDVGTKISLTKAGWKYHPGDSAQWADNDFDDSLWASVSSTQETKYFSDVLREGIGWFRLRIVIDSTLAGKRVALKIGDGSIFQFYPLPLEIYLNNRCCVRQGVPARTAASEQLSVAGQRVEYIVLPEAGEYTLAVRVSFHTVVKSAEQYHWLQEGSLQGYMGFSLAFVSEVSGRKLEELYFARIAHYLIAASVPCCIAFLHGLLFVFYRNDKSNVYLSLLALSSGSLAIVMILARGVWVSSVENLIVCRWILNPLFGVLIGMFMLLAIFALKREQPHRVVYLAIVCAWFSAGAFVIVDEYGRWSQAVNASIILSSLMGSAIIIQIIIQMWKQQNSVWIIAVGITVNLVCTAVQNLYSMLGYSQPEILIIAVVWGFHVIPPLSMSIFVAYQTSVSNRLLARQRNELDAEVKERTQELSAANEEIKRQVDILNEQTVMIELNNTQLQEQNHHLYVLNNEKNELMGIAAHDLKNPLASIRLMADMMLRYESRLDNEERREYLQNVLTASERMMAITSNILEINALEEGGIEFHCIPVNIVPITQTCVQDFLQRAEQKKLGLYCTAPNSAYAIADTQAVHQILDNLVSNAVKYSPHGKNIFVRVKASNEAVRVEVQDEGEGISPDDMKKLFGKFVRLSARPTGGEHSTGLGLSIVKKMVEAMNGRVWCESEVGKGATFIVELPKASEESHA